MFGTCLRICQHFPFFKTSIRLILNRIYKNNISNIVMAHLVEDYILSKIMCAMSINGQEREIKLTGKPEVKFLKIGFITKSVCDE